MADVTIDTIRQSYPQYNDMSDAQLAQGLHQKFYADMPFNAFASKIGLAEQSDAPPKQDAPTTFTEYGPDATTSATGAQSQAGADINAVGQGAVSGTGAVIAGAGRIAQAGQGPSAQRVLAALDLIDQGKTRDAYQGLSDPERQEIGAYRGGTGDDKAAQRAELQQSIVDYSKPNAAMRAGSAIEGAAPGMFPVALEHEGIQTGVGRMIGGVAPALAATAALGPLGAAATIASQTYDGTYQAAIAKGATHEEADNAAGKSAVAQTLTMALPVSRLMTVPVSLREGLAKTLVNLGQNGVEFGSANAVGTFANNYVASQTYDPARSLTQGVGQAGLEGAIAGLIIPAVGGIARAGATVGDVMKAPDVDTAIAAAQKVAQSPGGLDTSALFGAARLDTTEAAGPQPASSYGQAPDFVPPSTSPLPLPRILDLLNEDSRVAANKPDFVPPSAAQPPTSIPTTWSQLFAPKTADATAPEPQSVGAAASREMTPPGQIETPPDEAAANRLQGEVERLATPPKQNDTAIYIPGTKPTLAEITGDPRAAIDQKYNRQQPDAMTAHIEQENHNAEAVTDYFADTGGSAPQLNRMENARDDRAAQNIQQVFGDPQANRPPADPSPTIGVMQGILDNPRQAERTSVVKTISGLADKFYDADGNLKTDPYALYGIGEHINDLLRGVGDTETSSAARVLKMELIQIKNSLYDDIEQAAPGFAQYRADYQRDSQAIDAMKLLQDARLSLLNKDQHITPAKWFSFMKGVVQGRADPMDPASSLSEDQMDRLWNITDQLKRSTFIDAGSPRGSPTSMLQEWGKRFAGAGAHLAAVAYAPVVGNIAVEMAKKGLYNRSVSKEMNRVLNPDLGQPTNP